MKDIYDFIRSFDLHTIIVVGIAFYFLNGNITEISKELNEVKSEIKVIKTVLCMKNIMPAELATVKEK
jgi:hypothetical protein